MIFEFKLTDKLDKIVLQGFPKSKELDYFVKTINTSELPEVVLRTIKYGRNKSLDLTEYLLCIKNQYEKYLKAILSELNEGTWVFSYTGQKVTFKLKQFHNK